MLQVKKLRKESHITFLRGKTKMADRVGQQLGNYRLVRLLGKGGFAEVYLGQHVRLAAKQAAIKILLLSEVDARKFQEEAETTEKLVHPHIVRLLDFDTEQGTPFLVLDYAPGGSLRTRHPKGSMVPLASVEGYLKELTPALQYAHDQHILHRDIKPDNILIGRGGELLLSDFGIAVLTQTGRTSLSAAYGIGGTPYYMAPETYRGRPVQASDQYALAVVVYEWLCGSVPFSEGNFIQVGYQHSHEPVPPLREKNPAIPPQVEAVIMKALAKEPKDRFASVQTFAQAFEQACIQARQAEQERLRRAEEQERARQAEQERLRRAEQERIRQAQDDWAKEREDRARQAEAERLRQTQEEEQARQAEAEHLRRAEQKRIHKTKEQISPPGLNNPPLTMESQFPAGGGGILRRQVLVGLVGLGVTVAGGGLTWWIVSRTSPTPTSSEGPLLYTYRGHRDAVHAVAWSPDGSRIASGSRDHTVQVWNAADGSHASTYRGHTDNVNAVAWSPDGKRIASGSDDWTVQVWNAADGSHASTYRGHTRAVRAVAWSPDGRHIASGSLDHTVQVWQAV